MKVGRSHERYLVGNHSKKNVEAELAELVSELTTRRLAIRERERENDLTLFV